MTVFVHILPAATVCRESSKGNANNGFPSANQLCLKLRIGENNKKGLGTAQASQMCEAYCPITAARGWLPSKSEESKPR